MEQDKKILRTYTGDMTSAIEAGDSSVVRGVIHEYEDKENRRRGISPYSQKNRFFLFAGIFLVCFSLGAVLYSVFYPRDISVVPVEEFSTIIFNDEKVFLDISGKDTEEVFSHLIARADSSKVSENQVVGFYLLEGEASIPFSDLAKRFNFNLSPSDITYFRGSYLVGAVKTLKEIEEKLLDTENPTALEEEHDPLRLPPPPELDTNMFVLLRFESFANIFPVMRTWEESMFKDWRHLFPHIEEGVETELFLKPFKDAVVVNKNARVLYDENGEIVFMYVFLNDTNLLIAKKPSVITEILDRLHRSEVKK